MLNFDNSYVGEIDSYIINERIDEENKLSIISLSIQNELEIILFDYKNNFPLIIDEMKKLFVICRTYYNIVSVKNKKYLAVKYTNDVSFKVYNENNVNKSIYERDIRKLIIFNWLMCINDISLNLENKFYVRPIAKVKVSNTRKNNMVIFYSINEKGFNYLNSKEYEKSSNIPISLVKEWFNNSIELFYEYVNDMINDIDCDKLRNEASKIVNKYDKEYISWVNAMYNRVRDAKFASEYSESESLKSKASAKIIFDNLNAL
jgi:hypothetical protein